MDVVANKPKIINGTPSEADLAQLTMETLAREISLGRRQNPILKKMMNVLEAKRQKRGLGWSRPWNKYDLTVFRTHIIDVTADRDYLSQLLLVAGLYQSDLGADVVTFLEELLADPRLMAFVFYHNRTDVDGTYEGLTLSIGRKVPEDRRKRDRFDLILEDRMDSGQVDGRADLLRIYSCPWSQYQAKEYHYLEDSLADSQPGSLVQDLFATSIDKYNEWKQTSERQWSHWSINYIDYFGRREMIPRNTAFR